MKKQQSGFTLVEIAIVMVIIGLLLGGVLKGQEVITNAKIKNINNDVSGVSAAIYSYQDRYNALPGDDAAADAHVSGGINNGAATVGNGAIDGAYNAIGTSPADPANTESSLVWHHLRSAGLLSGDPLSSVAANHAFGASIGVQTGANDLAVNVNGLTGILISFNAIPADMAVILDSQADDNNPDAGSIRTSATLGTAYDITLNPVYDIMFEL